ncbi:MAG TPA: hypothetical protein VNJ01_00905 [Bacteriovoracaceae bacterium]|nr:hypothetical protein [Bacteriovoracaceae bacterium]
MKALLLLTFIIATLQITVAQDTLVSRGTFQALSPSARVSGEALVYRSSAGQDWLVLKDFKLSGGIVLDLKICGVNDLSDRYCLSLGTLTHGSPVNWPIPSGFVSYQKVLIFDVEMIENLGMAPLSDVLVPSLSRLIQ